MKHGATTRQPVYSGNRRISGLFQRTLADGSTVFEVSARFAGRMRRHRLEATTKTDAIAEARALRVDFERGESHRASATGLTVADLAGDWLEHLESRIGDRDPRRRYSPKTVRHYRQQLRTHLLPELGARPVNDVGVQDLRRLVDRLAKARLSPSSITGVLTITSGLLRFAVRNGLAERNPVRDLDRSDRPGSGRVSEPRYLTPPELQRLLAAMAPTFRPGRRCVCIRRAQDLGSTRPPLVRPRLRRRDDQRQRSAWGWGRAAADEDARQHRNRADAARPGPRASRASVPARRG